MCDATREMCQRLPPKIGRLEKLELVQCRRICLAVTLLTGLVLQHVGFLLRELLKVSELLQLLWKLFLLHCYVDLRPVLGQMVTHSGNLLLVLRYLIILLTHRLLVISLLQILAGSQLFCLDLSVIGHGFGVLSIFFLDLFPVDL